MKRKFLIILIVLIGIIVAFLINIFVVDYMPLSWHDFFTIRKPENFGSTITTISGSDTLKDSRAVINTNFTNLNNDKTEVSTTTLPLITTLLNLTSVGTIGTGTWRGTAIEVGYGGTGTTSPTLNQIMIGNGSSGFKVIGFGTSGQLLTSQGDGSAPHWSSPTFDMSLDYSLTGDWTFYASSTIRTLKLSDDGTATTTVTQADWNDVSNGDGDVDDANAQHFHSSTCVTGSGNKLPNVTGTEAITHGLGVAPTYITISAVKATADTVSHSFGTATSTNAVSQGADNFSLKGGVALVQASHGTSTVIYLKNSTGGTIYVSATISALSTTSFTINWGTNDTSVGMIFYTWSACR